MLTIEAFCSTEELEYISKSDIYEYYFILSTAGTKYTVIEYLYGSSAGYYLTTISATGHRITVILLIVYRYNIQKAQPTRIQDYTDTHTLLVYMLWVDGDHRVW